MFFPRKPGGGGAPRKATSNPAGAGSAKGGGADAGESTGGGGSDSADAQFSDRIDGPGENGGAGEAGAEAKGGAADRISSVKKTPSAAEQAKRKEELGEPDEKGECEVEIEMDPSAPECADDRYTLKSADGKYSKSLTVKDDKVAGDKRITLTFKELTGGTTYTMEVDPGAEGKPYFIFEEVPFKLLVAK